MAVSNWAPTRSELMSQAASTVRILDDYLDKRVERIHTFLFATPDADLLAAPYSLTQSEIDDMKAAYARLLVLRTAYVGEGTIDTPEDFREFPERIWGLGL